MTREERLDWLCRLRSEIYVFMPKEWLKPMDEALTDSIKALEQEPCDDAISRDAVLEAVSEGCQELRGVYGRCEELINALPPVTQKSGKWISVSERLPEDRRAVLVTAYWHETYQVMMASYYGDGLWWCVPFNNCGEHMQKLKPKAWMPLPEPYEPQESEDKE